MMARKVARVVCLALYVARRILVLMARKYEVTDRKYGEICNIVERARQGWPIERGPNEAPCLHTSDYARTAATKIVREILNLEFEDPRASWARRRARPEPVVALAQETVRRDNRNARRRERWAAKQQAKRAAVAQ